MFLTRTSCRKTTHANGNYGAWPEWTVSISVLPLTLLVAVVNGIVRGSTLTEATQARHHNNHLHELFYDRRSW